MTEGRRPRIAVIGSNMVDLVTYVDRMPVKGETVEAPSFEMGHGGKGANQAVAAAKLGASVVMVTAVGDDMFADATIRNLAASGSTHLCPARRRESSSGVAPIMVEPSGENSILIVKGANADLSPADIERAAEDLKTCDLILLQLEVPLETVYAAIAFGKRHGVKTVLNPAPATAALDVERIRDVDVLHPQRNRTRDPDRHAGRHGSEIVGRRAKPARQRCRDGHRHARLARRASNDAGGVRKIEPVPVKAVDTTGAGDAFVGSFARFFAAGVPLEAALKRAARYAADSVTRRGTQKAYASADQFKGFCETNAEQAG